MNTLITRITEWAATKDDIRSAVLLGSQAREINPADEWSDIDVSLFVTDLDPYLASGDWLNEIGTLHVSILGISGFGGQTQWRALFDDARDVEFALLPDSLMKMLVFMLQANSVPPEAQTSLKELQSVLRRGFRLLVDKDDTVAQIAALLVPGEPPQAAPPTETEFMNLVDDFWYHTIWVAKKLRRGELWTAKSCLDGFMKWDCVLPMIQWHTKSLHGWQTETWHGGRFIEEWAAPHLIAGLGDSFARYDAADIARALLGQMDAFRTLATETATLLGYFYPQAADTYCSEWVKAQLQTPS